MAQKSKSQPKKAKPIRIKSDEVDLDPDAWPKFEKLIKAAARVGRARSPKASH